MAIIFTIGFFLSKREPIGVVNPFALDPFDAVGSFAFQVALLVGILTYARALRWKSDPSKAGLARLILRGNILVLGAILLTLLADALAEFVQPFPPSYWGSVLIGDLAALFGLTLICGLLLVAAYWRVVLPAAPRTLTPADALDDLWTLVRWLVTKLARWLPRALVGWVHRATSARLFAKLPWLNPRCHPWRFAGALGAAGGFWASAGPIARGVAPIAGHRTFGDRDFYGS